MERSRLIREMEGIVGAEGVVHEHEQLRTYECDGLMNYRVIPDLVVLPETGEHVQKVVKLCYDEGIPFVARGSGTGLSGGALPVESGVLIVLSRMRKILEVDIPNQRIVVEPGVVNMWVSQEVADEGYYYAPDPASQIVSSIGGNLAENSGGVHCLKYGFTTNHVMGAEVVLPDGSVTHIGGGRAPDAPGYDLLGAFVGSEGTLGIATRITLRLCRVPEAVRTLLAGFEDTEGAGGAVSGIIGEGIIPAAIEMMDRLTMEAVEAAVHPGLPDAGAVLVIELDGPEAEVEEQFGRVLEICEENEATEIRVAEDDEGARPLLEGPQGRFRCYGPHLQRLLRPGRRHPAHGAPRGPWQDLRARRGVRPAGRQRLPRGGRESASLSFSTTTTPRARPRGPRSWPARSSSPAWSTGDLSPGSTASGRTRRSTCPGCSPTTT